MSAPERYIVSQIPSEQSSAAFDFHVSLPGDGHILTRTKQEIAQFCYDGEAFGVRKESTGRYVGFCYVHYQEEKREWELGGIAVPLLLQNLGLGSVLSNFALCHTVANQAPWRNGQEIMAHMHEDNQKPRNMLARIGFVRTGQDVYEDHEAPRSLKRNAEGKVVGHRFLFPKTSVGNLVTWLEAASEITLRDCVSKAVLKNYPASISDLLEGLREAAREI